MLLAALIAALLPAGVARAATITVTTLAELDDSECTLSDAITAANINMPWDDCPAGLDDDTITFETGLTGTIALMFGLPPITSNIDIQGPGSDVLEIRRDDGAPAFRIISVQAGRTASISGLTVSNGLIETFALAGAGIGSQGTLTLVDVVVTDNHLVVEEASENPAPGGGGIWNGGTLIATGIVVSENTVSSFQTSPAGATSADAHGAGIENQGTLTIDRSSITNNTATAIVASPEGFALAVGGGLHNWTTQTATLQRTTISGNTSEALAPEPGNTTERGGGVANFFGTTSVTSSTIASNEAGASANLWAQGTETVANTIISDPIEGPNCQDTITTDGGFNLEFPADCAGIAGVAADPQLLPLADNGGPTRTHALPETSPAVDAGTAAGDTADQRDMPRPVDLAPANADDGADIGAYERQVPLGTVIESGPNGPTTDSTPTFTFSAAPDAVSFECSMDTGVPIFGPCSGPGDSHTPAAPLPDAASTFHVRGIDASNIPDPDPATRSFVVDTLAPTDPTFAGGSHTTGKPSNDTTVEVAWSGATDALSGVDGFSYLWDTSPTTLPDQAKDAEETATGATSPALSDGAHFFHLRTVDHAGNWTSTVHLGPFVIDTVAPDTTLTKKPKKRIETERARVKARFAFASTEAGTFLCKLDGKAEKPCTSPFLAKVKPGKHVFRARAADEAGNADESPARYRFRVLEV